MREILPATAIGAVLGFASLFLRELGWVLAIAAMGLLGLYYARQRRFRAFAWLLLGGAGVWILLLAPVAIGGMTDPQGSWTFVWQSNGVFTEQADGWRNGAGITAAKAELAQ